MSAGQADPAEVSSPADDGGSGEGAESGDDSDEEGQDEDCHGGVLLKVSIYLEGVTYFRAEVVERVSHLTGDGVTPRRAISIPLHGAIF